MRWMDFVVVLALLMTMTALFRRHQAGSGLSSVFGYTALALFWLYLTLEVNSLLHWKLRDFQAGGISVLWTVFAFAFLAGGIWRSIRPLRFVGLALFAGVVGKVLFVDLTDMPNIYRFGALMVIGVLLLLGSFVYLRASKRFIKGVS
jgi:uncharacterized membrane protein